MLVLLQLRGKWDGKKYHFSKDQTRLIWRGPVALAKGGSSTTETVPTGPWGPQQQYITGLFGEAGRLYNQGPPQYYPGSTVAQTPQSVTQSQQMGQQFVQGQQGVNQTAINAALQGAMGAGGNPTAMAGAQLNPAVMRAIYGTVNTPNVGTATQPGAISAINRATTAPVTQIQGPQSALAGQYGQELTTSLAGGGMNPYLDQLINTGLRQTNQQFQENVIPGIRGEASQAGQVGGTRQGIAEGIAGRGLVDAQQDMITRLLSADYEAGRQERGQALQQLGATNQFDISTGLQAQQLQEAVRQASVAQALQGAQVGQAIGTTQQGLGLQGAQIGAGLTQAGTQSGIQQYLGALGLLPTLQGSQMNQIGFGNTLGLQELGLNQARTDADVERFFFNEFAPYNALAQYQNFIAGPYGSSVDTGKFGGQSFGNYSVPNGAPSLPRPTVPPNIGPMLGAFGIPWR